MQYFHSQLVTDMDIHIGDLHSLIVDREIEIIQELLDEILVYDQSMTHACAVCAELDCLLAFAEASRMYNYRRPHMVEENIIDIYQGRYDAVILSRIAILPCRRHPLQEQVVDTFVPNDARIIGGGGGGTNSGLKRVDEEWNSVLLCTGANACGKVCDIDPPLIYA